MCERSEFASRKVICPGPRALADFQRSVKTLANGPANAKCRIIEWFKHLRKDVAMPDDSSTPQNPMPATGAVPNPAPAPAATPAPAPYVRKRPVHQSMGTIDDYANAQDEIPNVTHDSGYTNPGTPISGRSYKRSRAQGEQLRRDLHYGQYLEIPKGRRDIFASREKTARIKTAVALLVLIVVLALIVFFLWNFMESNWGSVTG